MRSGCSTGPKPKFMKSLASFALVTLFALASNTLPAQVPGLIHYQGFLESNGNKYKGTGQFKFALLSSDPMPATYWSNDGTPSGQPANAVAVEVEDGLFSVTLGDASLANMTSIPLTVFTNPGVQLRIWFNDGNNGFEQLSPDQRIAAAGYAMMAASVADGAITASKLAPNAVTSDKIPANSITSADLADTITLQRLNLGGLNWDGTLNLYAKPPGGGGIGEIANPFGDWRGTFFADDVGAELALFLNTGATGAVLSARSPAGTLRLLQPSGLRFVELLAKGTADGGELRLRDRAGNTDTVILRGAETSTTGGKLILREADGTDTLLLDGEYGDNGGARIELRRGDGVSTVGVAAAGTDATLAGGGILRLGPLAEANLVLDGNEITARNNAAAAPLFLNPGGGQVAIATTHPATGYELSVRGQVICEELVVQQFGDWPDYVFASDYQLMPLDELEASIQENRHLPGVPKAATVEATGLSVGQMQKQMMEKIEELTLYVIEQHKRLGHQEAELNSLRAALAARP